MPTGYTAAILERDLTFKEYALSCARAFGALVTMRDDPMDAPIPDDFEPSDYSTNALQEAFTQLQLLEAMTLDEQLKYGESAKADEIRRAEDALAEDVRENEKFLTMRAECEAWQPPTPDHVEMKNFMVQQIDISLNDLEYYQKRVADVKSAEPMSFYQKAIESAKWQIQYHEKSHAEEVKRCQGRTDWIRALKTSLNQSSPTSLHSTAPTSDESGTL